MPGQTLRLTRDQVTDICGRLDDMKVANIIATGATPAELMEAKNWLYSDDYMGGALQRSVSGRVARLVELLKADEVDWEDQ